MLPSFWLLASVVRKSRRRKEVAFKLLQKKMSKAASEATEAVETIDVSSAKTSKTEKADRERDRIKNGILKNLGRLIVFSPICASDEAENWTIVNCKDIVVPTHVTAHRKLTKDDREQELQLEFLCQPPKIWPCHIFARSEGGRKAMRIRDSSLSLD